MTPEPFGGACTPNRMATWKAARMLYRKRLWIFVVVLDKTLRNLAVSNFPSSVQKA
jgi:hypothetical protein